MRMSLTRVADSNVERDGVDDWSSVDIVWAVIVLQLGGRKGGRRGNDAAQSTIVLACGDLC
jgi:hypothetical protein